MEGLVVKSTGSWYFVRAENGQIYQARLRGKMRLGDLKVTNPVAVGDKVKWHFENTGDNSHAVISEVLPRTNYLVRKSVHKTAHSHLIATNIDQALLLVTLVQPRTSLGFIDRFLVTAESFRIPVILFFNKADLYDKDQMETYLKLGELYTSLGYSSMLGSMREGLPVGLSEQLTGKMTLLSGHSGVGKSTLLNLLLPNAAQKTAEISSFANKGVHTTTFAELFNTGKTGYIIDTPGIKEFGLSEIDRFELAHYFPEMRVLLGKCRFHNCLHVNEPGCEVKNHLNSGEIALSRYQSYLSMLDDDDNRR